eukprot:3344168-Prymnesium_polylepis.2
MGIMLAFALTNLPVEEVKLKLIRLGALGHWGNLLGLFDLDQQQIALSALVSLLEGDAPFATFQQDPEMYEQLVTSLPPLLHGADGALSDPEILMEVLRLGSTLASHPFFAHASGDSWIWERLLEQSAANLYWDPAPTLAWACIAAACAKRSELADAMLRSDSLKRLLVSLADYEPGELGGGATDGR